MSDAQNMKGKCTQIAEDVRSHFDGLGSVSETVLFDGKEVALVSPVKKTAEEISTLVGKDAEANALNGWYARAIDAKNTIMKHIREAAWTEFLESGEEYTVLEQMVFEEPRPTVKLLNEDDILASWPANDLADFLIKEQYCATVGKLIHKRGKLHELYLTPQNVTSRFQDLNSGERGGVKAYPVTISPVYFGRDLQEVKEVYLAKHDEHRECEKKVNWYKANLNNILTEQNALRQEAFANETTVFNKKQQEFNEARKTRVQEVNNANSVLSTLCEARRLKALKEASALKIFIPEILRPIKKFVTEYKVL